MTICIASIIIMIKAPRLRKKTMYVLIAVLLLPIMVKAVEFLNISITSKVEINTKPIFCIVGKGCYKFTQGMTWKEWADSDYNDNIISYNETLNIISTSANTYYCDSSYSLYNYYVLYNNDHRESMTDVIVANNFYHSTWHSWRKNRNGTYDYAGQGISGC